MLHNINWDFKCTIQILADISCMNENLHLPNKNINLAVCTTSLFQFWILISTWKLEIFLFSITVLEQFIPIGAGNTYCAWKERKWFQITWTYSCNTCSRVCVCVSGADCATGLSHITFHVEANVYEQMRNESALIWSSHFTVALSSATYLPCFLRPSLLLPSAKTLAWPHPSPWLGHLGLSHPAPTGQTGLPQCPAQYR